VDSTAARNEAGSLAAATSGVRKVRNNLEVRTGDRSAGAVLDDGVITAKVDAELAKDERTSALRVNVATRSGEVQLSGFAKSAAEKQAAAEIARRVEGVQSVRNDIDVRGQ
jgi:osmotically-inducible protein OsmY